MASAISFKIFCSGAKENSPSLYFVLCHLYSGLRFGLFFKFNKIFLFIETFCTRKLSNVCKIKGAAAIERR